MIASFATGPGATTLPMKIYSQVRLGVTPEINAISTILIAIVTVGVLCRCLFHEASDGPRRAERRRAFGAAGLSQTVAAFVLAFEGALSVRAIVTAQDHTASYYAATANDATRYPALEGTVQGRRVRRRRRLLRCRDSTDDSPSAGVPSCCSKPTASAGAHRGATAAR